MMDKPRPSEIPDSPGSYQFRDGDGRIIYVGKAKSLRKRVGSYFTKQTVGRTQELVATAASVEWIVTETEVEAFLLEYTLIQRHQPRFNIRLRDDKSYPFLAITRSEEWPAAKVVRGRRKKGDQYFGPYAHAYAIRNTLDLLLKTFPVRTCTNGKFKEHAQRGRPCLLADIEKCSAPCVGAVDDGVYREHLDGLARFLDGDGAEVIDVLTADMLEASEALEFERAARLRDRLQDVEKALARQEVVSATGEHFDLIAIHDAELEAAVEILIVRKGRVVGRYESVVEKVEDLAPAELMAKVIAQRYATDPPPPAVLTSVEPEDADTVGAWLEERRGTNVSLRVPRRGPKRRLLETAARNAAEAHARHKLRHSSDPNQRAQALRSLQAELDLADPPLRIECYDISTIQGRHTVGSMVVLEDGLPRRSEYRRFKIRTLDGQDDFAAMEEMLRRRFANYVEQQDRKPDEDSRFAYPPSLVVIDGGAGQLGRAVKVLDEFGLDIPVVGLAKRMEEVYRPYWDETLRIPRDSPALHLLQRARDEAHRFAVTYHRQLRGKRMVDSILDEVPGIGPGRKQQLIKAFGSVKRMRAATEEDLAEVVPSGVAANLYAARHDAE
ncbi:MAG: excinuclease ABC subunit UvrC [Acidimicrobiia bacterium]|nr:MAG: excinuclease ABC subunit UvrC [Acidimicrobiia bacterium]